MKSIILTSLVSICMAMPAIASGQDEEDFLHPDDKTPLKRSKAETMQVPKAEPRLQVSVFHDGKFRTVDPFAWLRDKDWKEPKDGVKDPEINAYISAENAYTNAFLEPLKPVIEAYVQRRKAMMAEVDDSCPTLKDDGFYYFSRVIKTTLYPIYLRYGRNQKPGDAVVFFDGNKEAQNHKFFSVGCLTPSPNGQLLAYSTDTEGHEKYTLRVRTLDTGNDLTDELTDIGRTVIWTPDNRGFYYVRKDEHNRPKFVQYHVLGQPQSEDVLLYTESDEEAFLSIDADGDEKYLLIQHSTYDDDGYYGLELRAGSDHKVTELVERKPKRRFGMEHKKGFFYFITNDTGTNFRLVKVPAAQILDETTWQEILPVDKDRFLTGFQVMEQGITIESRLNGVTEIGILDETNHRVQYIPMPQKAYVAELMDMPYKSECLRYSYSSMSTPPSVIEVKFKTLETFVRKVREIPCGHNPHDYVTDRLFIPARDGAEVPVCLIYKKDAYVQDGTKPMILYGYGSYGINIDPDFADGVFPFLDKGFVYAVANIRGGSEMGYSWYLDGKMDKKQNTFNDYIDVARGLIARGYTSQGNITAHGGSAGGLLLGVAANQAPELFRSMLSVVPFVDLLNTMLDESLPLTPGEYQEWGNPAASPEVFARLQSYSPYDNMGDTMPDMYITGGVSDPRVTYWEPLKYVAKLRYLSPETTVYLRMETAGHGGGTSLDDGLIERGQMYAYVLKMHGLL